MLCLAQQPLFWRKEKQNKTNQQQIKKTNFFIEQMFALICKATLFCSGLLTLKLQKVCVPVCVCVRVRACVSLQQAVLVNVRLSVGRGPHSISLHSTLA